MLRDPRTRQKLLIAFLKDGGRRRVEFARHHNLEKFDFQDSEVAFLSGVTI